MSNYPEHEKLEKIQQLSQSCGEFVDWLRKEKNLVFGKWVEIETVFGKDRELEPHHIYLEKLLAEFFEIDQKQLDLEKGQMIQEILDIQRKRVETE